MIYTEEDDLPEYEDIDDEDYYLCTCPIVHDDFEYNSNVCGACGKRIV